MQQNWLQRLFYATGCVFELARGVIIFAVVLALLNAFVGTINIVNGPSMQPNFQNKQLLLVDKLSYLVRQPRRGEVVILKFPGDPEKTRYIKRIIGLPGETLTIKDNKVYINGKHLVETYIPKDFLIEPNMEIKLRAGDYFVMGDNRENSNDSRFFKAVERRFLIGLAYVILADTNSYKTLFKGVGLVPPQYYDL